MKLNIFKRGKSESPVNYYWIIMILLISTGITISVLVAYGKPLDIRQLETKIFANKIAECLSPDADTFRLELLTNYDEVNFLKECNIVYDSAQSYGFCIVLDSFPVGTNSIVSVIGGNGGALDLDLVEKKFLTHKFYVSDLSQEYVLSIKVVTTKDA